MSRVFIMTRGESPVIISFKTCLKKKKLVSDEKKEPLGKQILGLVDGIEFRSKLVAATRNN